MHHITKKRVWRNDRWVSAYLVRISRQDDREILRKHSRQFYNLKDAQTWRDVKLGEIALGELGEKRAKQRLHRQVTVRDLFLDYQKHVFAKPKPSHNNDWIMVRSCIDLAPELWKTSVADNDGIKALIVRYINDRLSGKIGKRPVKSSYVKRQLSPIRTMFRIARREMGYSIELDPFRELEALEDGPRRERILKPGEDLKLYRAIKEQCRTKQLFLRWATLVQMALTTALRRGVFLHLKWEDVDFENMTLTIKRTYWTGKKRAPPEVPLTTDLLALLKLYYDATPEPDRTLISRLFPSKDGKDGTASGYNSTWKRIIKLSGLEDFHFHDLRHTATTRYAQLMPNELTSRENKYLLGHIIEHCEMRT
jgi:integrase